MNRRAFLKWLLASVPAAASAIYVPKLMVPVAKIQVPPKRFRPLTHEEHVRLHAEFLREHFPKIWAEYTKAVDELNTIYVSDETWKKLCV